MRNYKPSVPFTTPMKLLVPTTVKSHGVNEKVYPDPDDLGRESIFFGSFRTFGGTENVENGIYTIINTATVDTWYRPDIKANCRICICQTGEIYDIVSDPENIEFRNQYLQFKVRKVGGSA